MRNFFQTKLFAVVVSGFLLSGCVSNTLDIANRGNVPISKNLIKLMQEKGMRPQDPILVRIFKKESELEVWKRDKSGNYALLKTYPMCRWSGQLGPKKTEGDRQAPEGFYNVSAGRLNPTSQYYLSFDLGYPNRLEKAMGYTGSALMVHGACSSSGCFAISDEYVAEVYAIARDALRSGQSAFQVHSFPFRMTPQNLADHMGDPNLEFWMDLKAGYDKFELTRQDNTFTLCEGRYRFNSVSEGEVSSDPLAKCPQFEPEPESIAFKTKSDLLEMNKIVEEGTTYSLSYVDGGMNPVFRKILAEKGNKVLSSKTSTSSVPVSRPVAALADPYEPPKDL